MGTSSIVASVAAGIARNPLGRLMFGHRELFHSNLLAWFFDELPEAADRVFQDLTFPGPSTGRRAVQRELHNLDLVMRWPGRAPLVIENKMFSLPDRAQLRRYSEVVETWAEPAATVLLSASAPAFETNAWRYMSYLELADRIERALPRSDSYEVATMRKYAELARDLAKLMTSVAVRSDDEPVWLDEHALNAIDSSQTRSALQKARGSHVAAAINRLLPELEQPADSGMSRSLPLVEAMEYAFIEGIHAHFGWQLQGKQFRRAVVFHDEALKGKSERARAAREDLASSHPQFFEFPDHLPQTHRGRRDFNHFAPSFVYRYVDARDMTVGSLKQAAREVHASIRALAGEGASAARPTSAVRRAP